MKHAHSSQAIGIFDSGIGGLTVARAIANYMPNENIIYFGDTAHMPYGDKSTSAIQAYSVKIAYMLLQQHCKLILIACNSASAAAFDLVKDYISSKALVMNVIDPVIHYLRENYVGKTIGLIGTKQTVNSNIYLKKLTELDKNIHLKSHATPLLASAIEEFSQSSIIDSLLNEYLTHPTLQNIDALLLACTHYPVIKANISAFYQHPIDIIDSSDIVATSVKAQLEYHNLLNKKGDGTKKFYISDYTDSFVTGTKLFFSEDIALEHYPLWE